MREHVPAVSTTPVPSRLIERVHKAVLRAREVAVDRREVVDRDAALREEDEPLV